MSNPTIRGKKHSLDELPEELENILNEFLHASFEARQEAVQKGAEIFKSAIECSTPIDTGKMAKSWVIQDKYKDRRYVGNTRTANSVVHRKTKTVKKGEARENVPLSNVLEYAENSPHKGFIRQTFDEVEPRIYATIKKTIENGVK